MLSTISFFTGMFVTLLVTWLWRRNQTQPAPALATSEMRSEAFRFGLHLGMLAYEHDIPRAVRTLETAIYHKMTLELLWKSGPPATLSREDAEVMCLLANHLLREIGLEKHVRLCDAVTSLELQEDGTWICKLSPLLPAEPIKTKESAVLERPPTKADVIN